MSYALVVLMPALKLGLLQYLKPTSLFLISLDAALIHCGAKTVQSRCRYYN